MGGGGKRGTHESLGAENTRSTLEALIFPLMGNNGGGSVSRNVNNTPFLTCVICPNNLNVLSRRDVEVLVYQEESQYHLNTNIPFSSITPLIYM